MPGPGSGRGGRGAWLAALLIAEGLALGVGFDLTALRRLPSGWWSPFVVRTGWLMPAATSMCAALVLIAMARSRAAREQPPWRLPHRPLPYVGLQLCAFASLLAVVNELFHAGAELEHPGAWIATSLAAAAATLGAWLAALVPPRALVALVRRHAIELAAGLALGALAFVVGRWAQDLWMPLRRATFAAAGALLGVFEPRMRVEPETLTLGAGDFAVTIAPDCSGYEGIGLAWVFVLASLALFRTAWRFPNAWLLLPLATLAAWSANVLRLVALVWIGAHVSPQLALGGFHSYAGTLLFCGAVLSTVALALRSPRFARAHAHDAPNPAAPYLVPFLASVAAALVARAFAGDQGGPLDWLPPAVGLCAAACFIAHYRRWDWRPTPFAFASGIAVAVVWAIAAKLGASEAAAAARPAGMALAVQLAHTVLVVPLIEELAFRGFLARRIHAADFESVAAERLPWPGIALSALAFGLLHRSLIAGVLAGIAYALIYRRHGRISEAVWAHAITNAALVVAAFATGDWALWK